MTWEDVNDRNQLTNLNQIIMKQIKTMLTKFSMLLLAVSTGLLFSCSGDETTEEPQALAPVANFQFTVSESNKMEVSFTNSSQNATKYSWDFGDDNASLEENPIHTYAAGGTYTVTLTSVNKDGVPATKSQEMTLAEPVEMPVANFTVVTSDLSATFTNTSTNASSYSWDFGDGTGTSVEESLTYNYTQGGTYTVALMVTNEAGSNQIAQEVTVAEPASSSILANGDFSDGDTGWTVVNHYEATNSNGFVTIAEGVAKFDETTNADWKHMGIYTMVTLGVGIYQFNMDMTYTEINDIWGEVYIGSTAPVEGNDYGNDQGATMILKAYNAWDCSDIKTYSGSAIESGCDTRGEIPGQGKFEITSEGTYYLLFRTGGGTYGTEGIIIDNISLSKTN